VSGNEDEGFEEGGECLRSAGSREDWAWQVSKDGVGMGGVGGVGERGRWLGSGEEGGVRVGCGEEMGGMGGRGRGMSGDVMLGRGLVLDGLDICFDHSVVMCVCCVCMIYIHGYIYMYVCTYIHKYMHTVFL